MILIRYLIINVQGKTISNMLSFLYNFIDKDQLLDYENNDNSGVFLNNINDNIEILKIVCQKLFIEIYNDEKSIINDININLKGETYIIQSSDLIYGIKLKVIRTNVPKSEFISVKADDRIGFFHNKPILQINDETINTYAIGTRNTNINIKDIKKIPWNYYIHSSVPDEYVESIKNGILSWNKYFNKNVFKIHEKKTDKEYPEIYEWLIYFKCQDTINTPYSATSRFFSNIISGEMLCGIIYMCPDRIKSAPAKHFLMSGFNDKKQLEILIQKNFEYVTAHEIGHNLGLRHMFTAYLYDNYSGSVMDYVDIFSYISLLDFPLKQLNINDIKKYDKLAIDYAYNQKNIDNNGNIPFGTDENLREAKWYNVIVDKNDINPLEYIEKSLKIYSKYRSNLLKQDKYTYNVLFMYVYIRLYKNLINICLRYIGGKKYNSTKDKIEYITQKDTYKALDMLIKIIKCLDYTKEESSRIVFNLKKKIDENDLIFIDTDSYYSMGNLKLFEIRNKHYAYIFNNILSTYSDLLESNCSYKDINLYILNKSVFLNLFENYEIKKCFIESINNITLKKTNTKEHIPELIYIRSQLSMLFNKILNIVKDMKQENDVINRISIEYTLLLKINN